ncbi:haloacid dehalogenase-like hydrolase [Wenjunlia tyrosinilytica]|uniref:phosphoserine phosphatase n=1 Tax=Wenjunlia tyrosinilytica TaxID=1544741 RepID=A0A917ZYF2_9ACTN|nr:haloacid dehalogenase-like hydrolase [Wenjunlia tyrosinilytica]GGO99823.1 putative conserved lipoprotein LppF [Wenjunlia tyrosinilytica]
MKTRRWAIPVAAAVLVAAAAVPIALATPPTKHRDCPTLDSSLTWYGENRQALQKFIDAEGECQGPGKRPLALFDWDNTVVKNDVGDATTFWLLRNDKVLQPPAKDWSATSRYLTTAAGTALGTACGSSAPAGKPLPTSSNTQCADEILSVYSNGTTTQGAPAFSGFDARRIEPSYAWAAQLLAGHSAQQVRNFAAEARAENLAAPEGATQAVGTHQVTAWVRYYDQQRDLISTLGRAGFDVRIITASPEPVVQVWAQTLGIRPDNVVGIRNGTQQGKLTYHLNSCGGAAADSVITYIDGKRCFINQEILGVSGAAAFEQQPASKRQAFAAGDSNTDVTFVTDATGLRLVINRNKAELMCRAYYNSDAKWLINPMFIKPKGALLSPYPCSTSAYVNSNGTTGPVIDTNGSVIPDQADTVY